MRPRTTTSDTPTAAATALLPPPAASPPADHAERGADARTADLHGRLLPALLVAASSLEVARAVVGALCASGACTAAEVTDGVADAGRPTLVLASDGTETPGTAWSVLPVGPEAQLRVAGPHVPPAALALVAHAHAAALARVDELERLRREATTDPLTGLANRRALDRHLAAALARTSRGGPTVALLLLDVDDLKVTNDVWGHPTGDRVLRRTAKVLADNARAGDVVARIGGDEFAMVLSGTGLHGAVALERRVQARMAQDTATPRLQASIGVATTEHVEPDPDELLAAADVALYRAKADAGRPAEQHG